MKNKKIGRAYGFINCRQPKEDVAWTANNIREFLSQSVPLQDRLELRVNQGLSSLRKSRIIEAKTELFRIVLEANQDGRLFLKPGKTCIVKDNVVFSHTFGNLYVIRASLPETANKAVADELAAIVNQMYNSPLYEENEPFRGIVTYHQGGKYILRK
jgi:hypothetical protein